MSRPDGPLLVLGIGNVLLRDEGVGVAVVRSLAEARAAGRVHFPSETEIVDGGTLGLDLLPMVQDASAVILVDAVDLGRSPGTVDVMRGSDLGGAYGGHVSVHQIGVGDLIAAARLTGTLPERLALVAVQPATIDVGLGLSEAVAAAVPLAAAAVRRELAAAVA